MFHYIYELNILKKEREKLYAEFLLRRELMILIILVIYYKPNWRIMNLNITANVNPFPKHKLI